MKTCNELHECPNDGELFKCGGVITLDRSEIHQGVHGGTLHSVVIWNN